VCTAILLRVGGGGRGGKKLRAVPARVVDDGDLVSAGGVTSGLDLGLHILQREFGPRVAHAVETLFEYERRGVAWRNSGRTPITI
jgi:transcriptional regulator GlxA family with amidase domain